MSKRETLLDMAKTYLWRAEIEPWQVYHLLNVLEALGHLEEHHVAAIQDDLEEMFSDERKKDVEEEQRECSWKSDPEKSIQWCIKPDHGCGNDFEAIMKMNSAQERLL